MNNEEIQDKIFEFAYKMAFRDATMRNAFVKLDSDAENEFSRIKKEIYQNYQNIVRHYIDLIFDNQKPSALNCIVDMAVPGKMNLNGRFTFGNCQKLLNMTAKYMYLSCYHDENKRELFVNCDCPMDGYMIQKVDCNLDYCFNHELAWSGIRYDNLKPYIYFQEEIRKQCGDELIPIEYDFLYWDA